MDDREPTIRSRELGEGLRQAMEKAGLNGKQLAQALEWSPSRVSRVLLGRRGIKEVDAASFLGACGVTAQERSRLLTLCREQDKQGWWQQYGKRLPKQLATLIEHESTATAIHSFEALIMPGLLQTGDYATALMQESRRMPAQEIPGRVAARLGRQNLFSGDESPRFTFFLHEFVLRLPVGGPDVMSGQLHRLLEMAVRPRVTIRVVPASIGGHPGTSGPFTFMEFAEYHPVIYLDSETSCLFLEKSTEIGAYQEILAGLDEVALNVRDSRDLIARLAIKLYSNGEGGHGGDTRSRLA